MNGQGSLRLRFNSASSFEMSSNNESSASASLVVRGERLEAMERAERASNDRNMRRDEGR